MRRLGWSLALMACAILVMIADVVWHSPLTMTVFLSLGLMLAGAAIVLFALDVREHLRVRVTVVDERSPAGRDR